MNCWQESGISDGGEPYLAAAKVIPEMYHPMLRYECTYLCEEYGLYN